MKKRLLLAVANPDFSFSAPNSAVANYLLTVVEILKELNFEVITFPAVHSPSLFVTQPANKAKPVLSRIKYLVKSATPSLFNRLSQKHFVHRTEQKHIELIKFIETLQVDFMIEFLSFGSALGSIAKLKKNLPYLLIYDAPLAEQFSEMYPKRKSILKKIIEKERETVLQSDSIICYSNAVAVYLHKKYDFPIDKCTVLPTLSFNHLTLRNRLPSEVNTIHIGFIGSFLKYHRADLLVTVFERLCRHFNTIKLLLIGFGECWHDVKAQVARSPARNNIILTGFLSNEQLEKHKQLFDIGVIPAYSWYGGPMKIFEYASLKIPVIAPRTPTIAELFREPEEILLIPENNPEKELEFQLEKLIKNAALRKEIGEKMYLALQTRYSKNIYKNTFAKVIESVLTHK